MAGLSRCAHNILEFGVVCCSVVQCVNALYVTDDAPLVRILSAWQICLSHFKMMIIHKTSYRRRSIDKKDVSGAADVPTTCCSVVLCVAVCNCYVGYRRRSIGEEDVGGAADVPITLFYELGHVTPHSLYALLCVCVDVYVYIYIYI